MGVKLSFLIVFVLLLIGSESLNWMAAGTFTPGNMSAIFDKINSISPSMDQSGLAAYAAGFSDYLNDLWDPAWNVVIVYHSDGKNYDAVVHGYAFRNHWFWLNGYKINIGYISFILWKDYNCAGWATFNDFVGTITSTFDSYTTDNIQIHTLVNGLI